WEDKLFLERNIYLYVKENKENKYIANKNILKWLLKNRKFDTIEMIKSDKGYIKWKTSHRIYEKNFMKEIVMDLAPIFKKINVYPKKISSNSRTVSLEFNQSNKRIVGVMDFKYLILEYAGVLFGKKL